MKAIIEFNLPEEESTYKIHNQCIDMYSVILDMKEELRAKLKYSKLNKHEYKTYEKVHEFLINLLAEYRINTDLQFFNNGGDCAKNVPNQHLVTVWQPDNPTARGNGWAGVKKRCHLCVA